MMRLYYFPANGAWAFVFGKDLRTAQPTSMGDYLFFPSRGAAIAEARRLGLSVDKRGVVSSINPFVKVHFPARTDRLFRMKKTGRFGTLRRRNPVTRFGSRARFTHKRLLPPSMFKPGSFRTMKLAGGRRLIVGRPKGERKTAAQAILTPKKNPPAKLIGRAVTLIQTTGGKIVPRGACPLFGLPGGSIFVRGFFGQLPAGTVTRIEYLAEEKAKREGLRNPATPWRHDFTAERRPIKKTRGGLLIPAGKKPLWGMR